MDQYDNIIKKAIYNHNKYKIEENLNDVELLHRKIIRDADKLDNFRVKETEHFSNIFPSKYNPQTINSIDTCENSGISAFEHFVGADKLSKRANNAEVLISDYRLTRYACYLIAQNGDPRKEVIALAQTYFAIQTLKIKISL